MGRSTRQPTADRAHAGSALRNSPRPRQEQVSDGGEAFCRDPARRLCYGAMAAFGFWLYAFGPALALLRGELHFSYTMLGVYSALWSVGSALVGVSFAVIARRLTRAALLWSSAAAATAGALLFVGTHIVALTLLGVMLLGYAGTTLLTCIQAILSDRHGKRRDRVLTEANIGVAACAVLAPPCLGLFQGTAASWRVAMILPVLALARLYVRYRHLPLPAATAKPRVAARTRLSLSCWLLATLVAAGVAAEWCVVYFGAELLAGVGLNTGQAATAMSSFYLGILGGRVGGAWLTRRAGRTVALLWTSLAITTAGLFPFWLVDLPAVMIAGLFLCGVGVANLYPLSVALTLAAAPGNGDTANARIQLLIGVFNSSAPFLLGSLADQLGLHTAFALAPLLIATCVPLLLTGLKANRQTATRSRSRLRRRSPWCSSLPP